MIITLINKSPFQFWCTHKYQSSLTSLQLSIPHPHLYPAFLTKQWCTAVCPLHRPQFFSNALQHKHTTMQFNFTISCSIPFFFSTVPSLFLFFHFPFPISLFTALSSFLLLHCSIYSLFQFLFVSHCSHISLYQSLFWSLFVLSSKVKSSKWFSTITPMTTAGSIPGEYFSWVWLFSFGTPIRYIDILPSAFTSASRSHSAGLSKTQDAADEAWAAGIVRWYG